MSKKPLSKAELKARRAEANKAKRKKIDYRAWANKYFKNPTDHLPWISSGYGPGQKAYCYDCRETCFVLTIKEDGTHMCGRCQNTSIELRERNPRWWKKLYWEWKQTQYDISGYYKK